MNLKNLADRIHGAGIAVKGTTLFLNMMPMEAQTAVLLRTPLQGTKIDYYLPGYFKTDFQVIVRTRDDEAGENLMRQVMNLLTFSNLTLGGQAFKYCRPRSLPIAFPLSSGNMIEHTVMFDCCFTGAG